MGSVQEALKAREERNKKREQEERTARLQAKKARIDSAVDAYKGRRYQSVDTDGVDQKYIDSFISDANTFISSAEKDYGGMGWSNAASLYESKNSAWDDLRARAEAINAWLYKNKDSVGEKEYTSFTKAISDFRKSGSSIIDAFKGAVSFYSQFNSEDSYNAYKKTEDEKQAVLGAADFDQYYQEGLKASNPSWKDSKPLFSLFGWTPFGDGDDVVNMVTFAEANGAAAFTEVAQAVRAGGGVDDRTKLILAINSYMTDDEKKIYNYYIGKGETEKANEYLMGLRETFAQREAGKFVSQIDNTAMEAVFSALAGIESFASGVGNIDNFFKGIEADPTTSIQYAQSAMRENNTGVWGITNDLINTLGNQLPSILVGAVTGGAGGALTMGISASGNAYAEMRRQGYNEWQSRGYSVLIGASEGLLSHFIGGISNLGGKLGGKLTGKYIGKFVDLFDNAIARTAIKLGGNMLSEGVEEAVQEVLDPVFKMWTTGEDFEGIAWDEVAYSGLLGALSAGVLEGKRTIRGEIGTYKTGKAVQGVDGGVKRLTELGSTLSADSVAYKIAGKVNENTGAYTIGRLYQEVGATLSEQNVADITAALEEKGMSHKTASKLAKQYQSFLNGEMNLTDAQVSVMENLDPLSDVLRKNIIGQNTTVYQRTRAFSDVMNPARVSSETKNTSAVAPVSSEEIARRRALAESGDFEALAREIAAQGVSVAPIKSTAKTGEFTHSDDGKTIMISTGEEVSIKEIASIKNGKVTIRTDKGDMDAKDVSFGTEAEALLYEAVTNMNAASANVIIRGFDPSEGVSAKAYAKGVAEAYRYGYYGYPVTEMSKDGFSALLTETQKNHAYKLGQIDGKASVAAEQKARTEAKENAKKEGVAPKKGRVFLNGREYKLGKKTGLEGIRDTSVKGMAVLADSLGVDVHFYQSYKDKNGSIVYKDESGVIKRAPHGYYVSSDGSIHIDLNAGNSGVILYTAAHELTHFIRQWSPAKFKVFADFLIENYAMKGENIEERIAAQIEKAADNGRKISYDTAYEEVIADFCQSMLSDGNAIQKIAELKATDKSLWQKIKDFISKIVAKIKAAYADLDPYSVEGRFVKNNLDIFEQLQTMWTEALIDASETFNAVGGEVDIDGDSNTHILSDRSMIEGAGLQFVIGENGTNYKVLDKNGKPVKSVTAEMIIDSPLGNLVTMAKNEGFLGKGKAATAAAKKQYEFLSDLVNMCIKYDGIAPVWEVAGTMVFSSMKSNADKQYGLTIDFSTVCKKTQAIVDAMSEAMLRLGRGLTRSEVETIYLEVGKAGESTPCPVCYVFSRWMGIGGILDQISRFQDKYTGMSDKELQTFIADIKQRIHDRAYTPNKEGKLKSDFFDKNGNISEGQVIADLKSKASSKAASALNAIAKNADTQIQIQELEALMKTQDAKEAKKTAKKIETLKKKLQDVAALEREVKATNDTLEEYEAYQWLTRTLLMESNGEWVKNPAFKPVPKDILFDLNKGDKFAENYPLSWAFRTGKGAAAGKAIVPYADARVGEAIQAVASQGVKDIKIGLELNPFLNGDTKTRLRILKSAIAKQARQNLVGGQRYQSTSDFRYEYGSDYLITFLEMQAIGAKVQLYTKVIEAVDFLASMGADCNLSVMPLSDGFITLPDGSKKLVYSSVTGINAEAAIQKSHEYDNVQLILVGISDEHIRLALEGTDVTFVIPFHGSGNNVHQIQTLMNLLGENLDVTTAQDYTAVQSDHVSPKQTKEQKAMWNLRVKIIQGKAATINASEQALLEKNPYLKDLYRRFYLDESAEEYHVGLTSAQAEQIFPYEYWDKSLTYDQADQNGERFKEYCASMGIIPRFSGKNSKGESVGFGDFTNDKGYWKLLIDRPMYNNKYDADGNWIGYGEYHEQQRINCSNFQVKHLDPQYGSATYGDVMSKANDPKKTHKIVDAAIAQFDNVKLSDREVEEISSADYQNMYNHFGATKNYDVAGYMLQNGVMLDFSGKHWGDDYSTSRQVDHRDIQETLDGRGNNGINAMIDMIGNGNIRLMPEVGGINLAVKPNETQMSRLRGYINHFRGEVIIDIDKVGGDTIHSFSYTRGTSSSKIISDIIAYFDEGIVPEQKQAGETDIRQFLFSDRVTDEETLDFLENQEHVTVYRAMQVIDGKLYPPMNAYTYDENGKKILMPHSEIGAWEQAVERPDLIDPKTGKFKLDKGKVDSGKRGTAVPAAYNPYIHTSLSMLNDQFTSAYQRSNLVVVKGVVPKSELTSGYHAQYAKDSVGETEWHSGVVSTQLPESRKVILSRWFKPVEILSEDVVAQSIKKMLGDTGIEIPYNVVSPKLRRSLEKIGVPIGEGRGLRNLPAKSDVKYSDRDSTTEASDFVNHMLNIVQNRGAWYTSDVHDYIAENPDLDFIKRIFNKDKTVKADLAEFLGAIEETATLQYLSWYMGEAYAQVAPRWGDKGKMIYPYRGAVRTFRNAIKNRINEIMTAKNGGTNLGVKNGEVSFQDVKDMFFRLNNIEDMNTLAEKVFATAEKLGVNIRFTNTLFGTSKSGDSFGDMVELKTSYFNDTAYPDQRKAQTILHELIHCCTTYVLTANQSTGNVHFDGSKSANYEMIANAATRINRIFGEIQLDSDLRGQYGTRNVHEFVAELANPEFVGLLKKKTLWEKIVDWVCDFFGFKKSTSVYDNVRMCVDYILDNPEISEYKAYALAARNVAHRKFGGAFGSTVLEDGQVRYSVREEYASEIDQWKREGQPDGEVFVLGETGDILQGLGAIESDIYMRGEKIKEILSEHPEMTLDEIKKIPQILENPVLILKSRNVGRGNRQNTRLVIFGSIKAKNGLPILSVLDLRPEEQGFVIDDLQKISSVYTKTTDPVGFVRNSYVLYAEKNKATSLLRTIGFHMPIELNKSGFIGSISYIGQKVNISGEKFSDIFSEKKAENKLSDRDSYAPVFYSHMGKVIDEIRLDKMGAGGVVSYLKGKGVKNEEIKWSGIEAFLEGKKSVTKEELQEFVAGSQLQIMEVTRDDRDILPDEQESELIAKYEQNMNRKHNVLKEAWKALYGDDFRYAATQLYLTAETRELIRNRKRKPFDDRSEALWSELKEIVARRDYLRKGSASKAYDWLRDTKALFLNLDTADLGMVDRLTQHIGSHVGMTDAEIGVLAEWIKTDLLAKQEASKLTRDDQHLVDLARAVEEEKEKISAIHQGNAEKAELYETKWSQYTLGGGNNYRELVFQMANSSYSNRAMRGHWGQDAEGVLAHARIQDFIVGGKRMLFIEEIQSDWHNEGHAKGYTSKEYEDAKDVYDRLADDYAKKRRAFNQYVRSSEFRSDADEVSKKKFDWLRRKMDEAEKRMRDAERDMEALKEKGAGDTPDAPFRDTYHEYVLKRLLRMAAEEGYDLIGWTPADIQSERWSEDYAEGYRIEYDQEIPKFLRKYGKKWGATVGEAMITQAEHTVNGEHYDAEDISVWSMPITDSMKQSVLHEGQPMYSDRSDSDISNRDLLANALESAVQNDIERSKLALYKEKIALINAEEQRLHELREQIKELSFAKGRKDTAQIRKLQSEAKQTENRINTYDRQLLSLEASKPLKAVLEREKKLAYKKAEQKGREALAAYREKAAQSERELMTRYQESRKKGIEGRHKTQMRHKIKDVVSELNQYLLRGTKDRHVPIELQKAVAEALDAVNMDTVGAAERIAKLQEELMKAKTPEDAQAIAKKIERIQEMGDRMNGRLQALKDAYDKFVNSEDPMVANSHDEVISNKIASVIEKVGSTPLRDMTLAQLEDVYDMYKAVLHTIRAANKAFKAARGEEISTLGNRVMEEVEEVGGSKTHSVKALDALKGFAWNGLKPIYAMEAIGSKTLTALYENIRAGEDTWAVDVSDARDFFREQAKKHGYHKWDSKKQYQFETKRGEQFSLTLEQMMSLYAYSKRKQADLHLDLGGFVFDEAIEVTQKKNGIPIKYTVNTAKAHAISKETLASIVASLTPEQKAFVDTMQDYLSTTMGEKGNEVSLQLYGIKLFKEKHYFPLKSAKQFMYEQNEVAGEVKIKNSGFSKETVVKANNPIILSNFMDVWSQHVNDMSMYHAFVLPLEDFNRVFNYKTPTSDQYNTESVKMFIQNAYGSQPISYIRQLLTDLNGGARSDSRTGIINKMIGIFKKSAVFASASVVVQQPSSIARAMALIDAKYFVGKPSVAKHGETWAEVKKYAPVAIIKEMGYFDTNMGMQTTEWITSQEYDGFTDKMKALVRDGGYRDEMLSKAPALADELAWCAIWNAVKRETSQTRKDLTPNSEEFLKAVGERFTEVVTKTQVYDSVLSRSGMMRSKDTGMKMATAFMAEPTTSINMIANAIIQGKRGDKRYARKAIGSVAASMILNSILVSFVYAGRDDDEEKTYAEKYIGTLTEELLDSFNPLTLIPFVKDIVSIAQGYDVERSDMAVVTDLFNAWNNLSSDNRSTYRKVEDFAGAIASIFGLPVKNIMRDARAAYNTVKSFINGEKTTGAGIKEAVREAVTGDAKSNGQQLYEAILNGDTAQIERIKGRFKDQDAINSAIRTALRENDSRIKDAAKARYNGDISEYTRIAKQIIGEGHFSQDNVVAAINAEINALKKGNGETTSSSTSNKVTSIYKMDDYYAALVGRDEATAYAVKEDMICTAVANGKDRDEAESNFNSSFASYCRKLYEEGELSDYNAIRMLVNYGGKSEEEAASKVQYWAFKQDYPDYDLSEEAVAKYYTDVEPFGIGVGVYHDYYTQRSKCKGTDNDGDGKTDSGSVKTEVLRVINSLPLTYKQKDALYYLNGWSESTIWQAPWH